MTEGVAADAPGSADVSGRRAIRTLTSRASWNLVDQALSSATNVALSILVARAVDAEEFGAFAIAFTLYSVVVLASRAVHGQPLAIRLSGASPERFREAMRESTGAALTTGVVLGLATALGGLALGGSLVGPLLAMGVVLPGLLLQDAWRMAFFAQGRPARAALNDAVWGVAQLAAVLVLIRAGQETAAPFVVAWGLAAGVAGLLGIAQARARPRPATTVVWVRRHWPLTRFMLFESMTLQAAYQGALLLVGAIGTLSEVGALRGAQVVLGPVSMLVVAALAFAVPEVARRPELSPRTRVRIAGVIAAAMAFVSLSWGIFVLLLPDRIGAEIVGASWPGVRSVLVPTLIGQVAAAAMAGPACVLLGLGRVRETFQVHMVLAVLLMGGGVVGLVLGRAPGAALGFAVAYWVSLPRLWARLRTTAELGPVPTGTGAGPPGTPVTGDH